jgi:FAD-dependent urate hydroxylase
VSAHANRVLVVGAGPYGLSVAAHLRAMGVEPRVVGEPMAAWDRSMPKGMRLKSGPFASSISGPPGSSLAGWCAEGGIPPPGHGDVVELAQFTEYGHWFARQFVPGVEETLVHCLERDGHGFSADLATGETIRAEAVVVATGPLAHAHLPPELRDAAAAASSPVTHPSQHDDLGVFSGRRVVVVGAGQSALESAALLAEAGAAPTVVVRRHALRWDGPPLDLTDRWARLRTPPSGLGSGWSLRLLERHTDAVRWLPIAARLALVRTTLGPSGSWWLRPRVEGRVPVVTDAHVLGCRVDSGGTVRLELVRSGRRQHLDVDHVLVATGYRFDVRNLGFLHDDLAERVASPTGFPVLDRHSQSRVPGLFFTGLASAATFGPLMRFVVGTADAGPRVARAAAAAAA